MEVGAPSRSIATKASVEASLRSGTAAFCQSAPAIHHTIPLSCRRISERDRAVDGRGPPGGGGAVSTSEREAARVLVVEDAPEFVEMLVPLLQREGYTTEAVGDGEAGVLAARSFRPDVIVLDLTLPRLDGVEVCKQVRQFSDAYVIMVTSRSDEVDRVVGLEVGADDYLT